jgi:hypothetical protein
MYGNGSSKGILSKMGRRMKRSRIVIKIGIFEVKKEISTGLGMGGGWRR